jgi:hypothetical protein
MVHVERELNGVHVGLFCAMIQKQYDTVPALKLKVP